MHFNWIDDGWGVWPQPWWEEGDNTPPWYIEEFYPKDEEETEEEQTETEEEGAES